MSTEKSIYQQARDEISREKLREVDRSRLLNGRVPQFWTDVANFRGGFVHPDRKNWDSVESYVKRYFEPITSSRMTEPLRTSGARRISEMLSLSLTTEDEVRAIVNQVVGDMTRPVERRAWLTDLLAKIDADTKAEAELGLEPFLGDHLSGIIDNARGARTVAVKNLLGQKPGPAGPDPRKYGPNLCIQIRRPDTWIALAGFQSAWSPWMFNKESTALSRYLNKFENRAFLEQLIAAIEYESAVAEIEADAEALKRFEKQHGLKAIRFDKETDDEARLRTRMRRAQAALMGHLEKAKLALTPKVVYQLSPIAGWKTKPWDEASVLIATRATYIQPMETMS